MCMRGVCVVTKVLTYPPPTNNVCSFFDTTFEVLFQLIPRTSSGNVLLLKCLNRVAKIGTTILG